LHKWSHLTVWVLFFFPLPLVRRYSSWWTFSIGARRKMEVVVLIGRGGIKWRLTKITED
jgi:hypothetical protein